MTKIPEKSSFKLTEVGDLTGVKPYVLRFWETQFDGLTPISSASGQKLYDREQIELILKLHDLLQVQKVSVDEARAALKELPAPNHVIVRTEPAVDYSKPRELCREVLEKIKKIRADYNWA